MGHNLGRSVNTCQIFVANITVDNSSQVWSADPLGVLKIFSEEILGQNYFHNNKKQLLPFLLGSHCIIVQKQCELMSKLTALSQSLHSSVPKSGMKGLFHLRVSSTNQWKVSIFKINSQFINWLLTRSCDKIYIKPFCSIPKCSGCLKEKHWRDCLSCEVN